MRKQHLHMVQASVSIVTSKGCHMQWGQAIVVFGIPQIKTLALLTGAPPRAHLPVRLAKSLAVTKESALSSLHRGLSRSPQLQARHKSSWQELCQISRESIFWHDGTYPAALAWRPVLVPLRTGGMQSICAQCSNLLRGR